MCSRRRTHPIPLLYTLRSSFQSILNTTPTFTTEITPNQTFHRAHLVYILE